MAITRCPACNSSDLTPFYEAPDAPVHSVLLMRTREEAIQYPRGAIRLAFCERCGFITNQVFEPGLQEYSTRYEETQGFSPTFSAFHRQLAQDLIDAHDLRGKDIVEIGCGKGEFLLLLCQLGGNRGVGIDPAYVPGRLPIPPDVEISFIQELYSEKHAHLPCDFLVCKMTLEHISDVAGFVGTVRRALDDRPHATVFFQVPDMGRILDEVAFWDVYYEHCSYFTREPLRHLFESQGFEVLRVMTGYGDQYLMIEARPTGKATEGASPSTDLHDLRCAVERFTSLAPKRIHRWRELIRTWGEQGERVILWGGGSKGVAFLTTLQLSDEIACVVDINPHKHGTFMPGTGHEIIGPERLKELRPTVVVVMNPIYHAEIQADLAALGLTPLLVDVTEVIE